MIFHFDLHRSLRDDKNKPTAAIFRGGSLQRRCACGGTPGPGGECAACREKRLHLQPGPVPTRAGQPSNGRLPGHVTARGHDFGKVSIGAGGSPVETIHADGMEEDDRIHRPMIEAFRRGAGLPLGGVDEFGQWVGPSDAQIKYGGPGGSSATPPVATPAQTTPTPTPAPTPTPTPAPTPCPTSVSVGAVDQRNHSNLSTAEKDQWRTWLGAMSRMDVGPGPDHTGHCMKEHLTLVSNNCPAAVHTRGGQTVQPCSGNKCLDINRYGTMWGVSDGPTAFLDMHRTRFADSLLEGTRVNSCSVVCEQTYTCDRQHATTGTFRITRNYQAGTHTMADGTVVHITTGTVTKT